MVKEVALTNWEKTIADAEDAFTQFADPKVFAKESIFAIQACKANDYLASIADNKPQTLRMAIINVATLGLTLNPQQKLAYLVPRKGSVILDISYQGLRYIAINSGSIKNAIAENVYSNDMFQYNGRFDKPIHKFDPFAKLVDRGSIIGSYCISILPDDSILVDTMSLEEIEKIRASSELFKKDGSGPWKDWFERMTLKTAMRRASSSWPRNKIVSQAIALIDNSGEGLALEEQSNSHVYNVEPEHEIDKTKVDPYAIAFTDKLLKRLMESDQSAFEAGKQLVKERLSGANQLYALDRVNELEKELLNKSTANGTAPEENKSAGTETTTTAHDKDDTHGTTGKDTVTGEPDTVDSAKTQETKAVTTTEKKEPPKK
jgi:recombination protein RecT